MEPRILAVDRAFTPDRWVDAKTAMNYLSRGIIRESFGETALTLRGGTNAKTGRQSVIELGSVIVVDTKDFLVTDFGHCPLSRELLFRRDRNVCAYCGEVFKTSELEQEHVVPASQGGPTSWENLVSSCHRDNQRKRNRTPEQAGMPLLYLPYKPNRFEHLILENRNVLADQMEWLRQRLPRHSRLHS